MTDDTAPQRTSTPEEGWRLSTDINALQEGWLTRGRLGKAADRRISELGDPVENPNGTSSRKVTFGTGESEWWHDDGTAYEINSNPVYR